MSKHRDHLITERVKLNEALRVKHSRNSDFLEHEGELLDDEEFEAHIKAKKPIPYSHAAKSQGAPRGVQDFSESGFTIFGSESRVEND